MPFDASSRVTLLSAATATILISGNNINNVTLTGPTASQPTSFKEWSQFYNSFEVISSKLKISIINADNTQSFQLTAFPEPITTTILTNGEAATQKFAQTRILGEANGIGSAVLNTNMHTLKLFGTRRSETAPFVGIFNSSGPQKEWFWNITFGNPDSLGTAGIEGLVKIQVIYLVRLFQRKILRNVTLPLKLTTITSTDHLLYGKLPQLHIIDDKEECKDDKSYKLISRHDCKSCSYEPHAHD
jgi:hypothetical protein